MRNHQFQVFFWKNPEIGSVSENGQYGRLVAVGGGYPLLLQECRRT
jgi:hypothetical protein